VNHSTRPSPFLVADHAALDFLNSVCAPWGDEIEWISSGRDLLDWLELAELVPTDVVGRFAKQVPSSQLDNVALEARQLRTSFRNFVVSHAGKRLNVSMLAELSDLNRLLANDQRYRQIESYGEKSRSTLRWREKRHWQTARDLLLPIAEAMGDLVCDTDFRLVKNCSGPACTLWFYDITKNHARRWCSMELCGNRAKAAAHRSRTRKKVRA